MKVIKETVIGIEKTKIGRVIENAEMSGMTRSEVIGVKMTEIGIESIETEMKIGTRDIEMIAINVAKMMKKTEGTAMMIASAIIEMIGQKIVIMIKTEIVTGDIAMIEIENTAIRIKMTEIVVIAMTKIAETAMIMVIRDIVMMIATSVIEMINRIEIVVSLTTKIGGMMEIGEDDMRKTIEDVARRMIREKGRTEIKIETGAIEMTAIKIDETGIKKKNQNGRSEKKTKNDRRGIAKRSEEHTSELQSPCNLVCRLLLEKKKKTQNQPSPTKKLMQK